MMRNQGQLYLGGVIILIGVLFLVGNITNVNIGDFCWPAAFILLGVWLLVRPRMLEPGVALTQKLFGSIDRDVLWHVVDEEFWTLIADVNLDMSQTEIAPGETRIRFFGFIGDIDMVVPADVGVSIASIALFSEVEMPGTEEEGFVAPLHLQTDDYEAAERTIRLEATFLVADIAIRRA